MQLTTLMDILEQEIGASSSARSQLAAMVTERAQKDAATKSTPGAAKPRKPSVRARTTPRPR
jgi:hypothetical protein